MFFILEGLKDILKDLLNPRLLILKAAYFFLLFGVVILWPHFSIYQKTLGLSEYQTGLFSSATSVLAIFIPFVAGFIGDKVGNYRLMLSIVSTITAGFALLFLWVPSAMLDDSSENIKNTTLIGNTSEITNTTSTETDPDKLVVTFWVYMVVQIGYGICQGTCYTLFEAAVMANMQNSGINFGYQRAWGTLGVVVSSSLGGYLLEYTGTYSILFYISAAMQFLTGMLMLGVDMNFKVPANSLSKDIWSNLKNFEGILLFAAMLAAGMYFGYIETFMYRYLFDLGATSTLIGLTVTVGAPFELAFTLMTSYFVRKVGHAPLITLGLFAYSVRFLGFSFLVNPWWVLSLEIMETMANGIFLTTAIMYCTVLFPIENIASFRGVFSMIYGGVGKLLGIAIGGEIRQRLGHVITFRIWSAIALVSTLAYIISYLLMKRYKSAKFSTKNRTRNDTEANVKHSSGIANKGMDRKE